MREADTMAQERLDRRQFVRGIVTTAAVGGLMTAQDRKGSAKGGGGRAIRLGGPIFAGGDDPGALAAAHRRRGYRAAYCPRVSVDEGDRVRAIAAAFATHDVVIAEVGRWVNLLDPDPARRRENLRIVTEGLALAEAIGARCCVDIAGSFNEKVWYGPHPDNLSPRFFDAAVENARRIIDAVKPKRAAFAYEMMGWALPDSPDAYLRMRKAVDRTAFAVHLDPCNLVNCPARFYRNADLIDECFEKLGPWIVSCHAKDLRWEVGMNVHFREVRPGTGSIDYPVYLRRLAALPHEAPLMLEHLPDAEEYDRARRFVLGLGAEVGVRFE
jgi:sugar phosphate isomerase/epimerase